MNVLVNWPQPKRERKEKLNIIMRRDKVSEIRENERRKKKVEKKVVISGRKETEPAVEKIKKEDEGKKKSELELKAEIECDERNN